MCFFTNSRAIFAISAIALLFSAAVRPAISAQPMEFERPDAPVRITGGDWVWEYEPGRVIGEGKGGIKITWGGGIKATAETARLARPPLSFELGGAVRADFEGRTIFCRTLKYDEVAGILVAEGGVKIESQDPKLTIGSDVATFFGAGRPGAKLAFSGGVSLTAEREAIIECGELVYFPDTGFIQIEGEFSGEMPLAFISDAENPFHGRTAKLAGKNLFGIIEDGRIPAQGIAENVTISTGNAEITAPEIDFSSYFGENHLTMYSRFGRRVRGWFIAESGELGEFGCDVLQMAEKSGKMTLSGGVEISGEGIRILSGLVNLHYSEGYYKVTSESRTEIDFDDLRFLPGED